MRKTAFAALYVVSPLVPICLYFASLGWILDSYALSVALGICAFVVLCNQLILAARPHVIVKALGQKHITMLHSAMPLVIIVFAVVHRFLKAGAGFDIESTKAKLGLTGLILMLLLSVLAFLILSNLSGKFGDAIRRFRTNLARKWNVTYKGTRAVHGLTALAAPLLLVHLFLASSADFSRNPAGALWLAAYAAVSLYLFVRYRASDRKPRKEKR